MTRVGLFAGIDWPELEAIAHGFDEELFPEGQRILRRGLGGSGLYLILEGEAAVTERSPSGCFP